MTPGSGWGTHVNPWLSHVNVWQKPLQYCKVISLQRIKINAKKIVMTPFIDFSYIQRSAVCNSVITIEKPKIYISFVPKILLPEI